MLMMGIPSLVIQQLDNGMVPKLIIGFPLKFSLSSDDTSE